MTHLADAPRRLLRIGVPTAVVAILVMLLLVYLRPAAPREISFYAGPPGSIAAKHAQRYAEYLGERGVDVDIVHTLGAADNLKRLAGSTTAAVALVESTVTAHAEQAADLKGLASLGSMYLTPIWLFVTSASDFAGVAGLRDQRLLVGPRGSTGRAITDLLAELNGFTAEDVSVSMIDREQGTPLAAQMQRDDISAVLIMGDPDSANVERLFASPGLTAVPLPLADAYEILLPSIVSIRLPRGVLSPARDLPPRDLEMAAAVTSLVTHLDLHPAAMDLLMDAASSIHTASRISSRHAFPSAEDVTLPLSDSATRYYREGPPAWRADLPYALATLVDLVLRVLLPAATIGYAVFKLIPLILVLRFRIRLAELYRRLRQLDARDADAEVFARLIDESSLLRVPPLSYVEYFDFRQHSNDVRDRVTRRRQATVE